MRTGREEERVRDGGYDNFVVSSHKEGEVAQRKQGKGTTRQPSPEPSYSWQLHASPEAKSKKQVRRYLVVTSKSRFKMDSRWNAQTLT